ncbi:MAG: CDP-glucose 4,6-dehydratase [Coriobacteriia bacterium]
MPPLFRNTFVGRRILLTGHTGFKGSWLARWLLDLGADVTGYALEPDTEPSLFADLCLDRALDSRIGDVRDAGALSALVTELRPEIVLHLAAQPLVRRSYAEPRYTFETNIMGTVNVLEAVRGCEDTRVVVNVTTDKVYENPETGAAFSEDGPLGGHDPYSASKAGSEIVTTSYRRAFFSGGAGPAIATARAGNVIGGGDWAADRLVPDCARALSAGDPVIVRNPDSVRPWQHVLEPLSGYLHLAASLLGDATLAGAFNFGPDPSVTATVGDVVGRFVAAWGEGAWETPEMGAQPHEAGQLRLDIEKSRRILGWFPIWDFEQTVDRTARWYRQYHGARAAADLVAEDLAAFGDAAHDAAAPWA